jgi:hypothetical protein
MGPHENIDEEAADADDESQPRPIRPYHDDPEDSDSIGADSPLRQTPTIELERNPARPPSSMGCYEGLGQGTPAPAHIHHHTLLS